MRNLWHPARRTNAFATCGTIPWVLRSKADPSIFKLVTAKCHDRFCSPCVIDRQAVIRRNLETRLTEGSFRFLTLTVRHHHDDLRPLLNRLYAAFRNLRQTAHWKNRVDGGVCIFELTYDPAANGWHPHLHCILAGRYLDVVLLRRSWLATTGDSTGVDISLIRTKQRAIDYVCKYSTKAMPTTIIHDPAALTEALDSLSKRRLLLCFGTWQHYKLLTDPADSGWQAFGSVADLEYRRQFDDQLVSRVLSMLHTADPETAEFVVDLELPPPEE